MARAHSRCLRLLAFVGASVAPIVFASDHAGAQGASRAVLVVGTDYAFTAPDTVRAGRVTFRFANHGLHGHEVAILLARRGTTAAEITAAAQAGVPAPRLAETYADGPPMGALFAAPGAGSQATLVTTLERGRTYVLVCTLRNAPSMPQHAMLGMFRLIYVR